MIELLMLPESVFPTGVLTATLTLVFALYRSANLSSKAEVLSRAELHQLAVPETGIQIS
jgi:hypothetical protein